MTRSPLTIVLRLIRDKALEETDKVRVECIFLQINIRKFRQTAHLQHNEDTNPVRFLWKYISDFNERLETNRACTKLHTRCSV